MYSNNNWKLKTLWSTPWGPPPVVLLDIHLEVQNQSVVWTTLDNQLALKKLILYMGSSWQDGLWLHDWLYVSRGCLESHLSHYWDNNNSIKHIVFANAPECTPMPYGQCPPPLCPRHCPRPSPQSLRNRLVTSIVTVTCGASPPSLLAIRQ